MPATIVSPDESSARVASAQLVIDDATQRLVAEFHPEQVWLFGSYAWGEPAEDSDIDFLVVLSESDESPSRRMQRAHRCLSELPMPKDVLVQTRAEFDKFRHVVSSLTYKIANEGRLLHG